MTAAEARDSALLTSSQAAARKAVVVAALTTIEAFPMDGSVRTLGWGVAAWVEEWLLQPDGDEAGSPYRLTREQLNFVLWFYAVDSRGKFLYRRAVLRRAKGWGKSPFLGALCLAELAGPVRFDYWGADGEAVGKPHPAPWVVIAGVSETQTENTMAAIRAMVEESDLVDAIGLDVGKTRIFTPTGGKLTGITSSSSTSEGARPSMAVMDETHHWSESNGGHALARVIRRNLAKSRDGSARAIETTNAHAPGEDSVAEMSYLAYLAAREGRSKAKGILYDSREAPGNVDLADRPVLLLALAAAYGDSTWVDLERIADEVYDPNTPPEEARRFYLNQITAAADSWLAPHEYDANERVNLAPLKVAEPGEWRKGDTICLGFDGGRTDDSSAVVAVRVSDGAAFLLGLWEKPDGPRGVGWEVDHDQVRDAVDNAFATLDVIGFFSDVAYWETTVDHWRDEYQERLLVKATTRHTVAWDMRSHQGDTVRAVEALHRAFIDQEVPHDGDQRLRRHVLNARRRPNRWGVSFGKETRESPKKVDALAALLLARMARSRVLADGVLAKRRQPVGRLVGF
ncbi:terminase [Actinoplanes cyaneus]|uniref:Terminase n=1 Tax=Actinoplanes cyaneus TaxID=52696 RepID=A0A919IST7_9ACTN|nr:terminase [Actinoplanes cyaneus]MCW2139117.1 Phage terminase-like protein, large subunit, contains N-terminal HTH domain [Actinoplanes cyaneus]GID68953.1 terminase [Actinoplanes cyaneus]